MDHDGIQLQLHKYRNKAYVLTESLPYAVDILTVKVTIKFVYILSKTFSK